MRCERQVLQVAPCHDVVIEGCTSEVLCREAWRSKERYHCHHYNYVKTSHNQSIKGLGVLRQGVCHTFGGILPEGCYLRLLPLDEPLRKEPDELDELERDDELDDEERVLDDDDDERDDETEELELRLDDELEPVR